MAGKGGARPNAGRKLGIGVTASIEKHVYKFVVELLQDDLVRAKAVKQLALSFDSEQEQYLYIIKNGNLYKVGYSSNFKNRIKNYKAHLGKVDVILLYKTEKAFEIEAEFHQNKLDAIGVNSEWYEFSESQLENAIRYLTQKVYKNGW
jgi:predicted GIY-YIG superfamily endonuclease